MGREKKWSKDAHLAIRTLHKALKRARTFQELKIVRALKSADGDATGPLEERLRQVRALDLNRLAELVAAKLEPLADELRAAAAAAPAAPAPAGSEPAAAVQARELVVSDKNVSKALEELCAKVGVERRQRLPQWKLPPKPKLANHRDRKRKRRAEGDERGAELASDGEGEQSGAPVDVGALLGKLRAAKGKDVGEGGAEEGGEGERAAEGGQKKAAGSKSRGRGGGDAGKSKPKNRMGQRERRRLREAEGGPRPDRPVRPSRAALADRPARPAKAAPPDRADKPTRAAPAEPVHPSWEAKRKQAALAKIDLNASSGSKVVFD